MSDIFVYTERFIESCGSRIAIRNLDDGDLKISYEEISDLPHSLGRWVEKTAVAVDLDQLRHLVECLRLFQIEMEGNRR